MGEYPLQLIASLKIIALGFWTYLYGLGGIWGKWKRRYVGASFLGGAVCIFALIEGNYNHLLLAYTPLLIASLSIGYGGDTTAEKLMKRFYYGMSLGLAALPIAIATSQYIMFAYHIVICTISSMLLGVLNPITPREEETLIAGMCGIIPLFMI